MSKRLVGSAAVRLYPRDIRESRGKEILGTLLDAADASLAAFVRQLASLIVGGLVVRSRRALAEPPGTLAASAACWAAIVTIARIPGHGIDVLDGRAFHIAPAVVRDDYVLPLVVLAAFTLGGRRLTGLLGLAWVALAVREWSYGLLTSEFIVMLAFPAVGFVLLTIRPRTAPKGWQARSLWLLPAVAWVLINLPGPGFWLQPVLIPVPAVVALVLLPVAPAFAVGTALAWSATSGWFYNGWFYGAESIWMIMLLGSTLVAVALVAVGRRATIERHN